MVGVKGLNGIPQSCIAVDFNYILIDLSLSQVSGVVYINIPVAEKILSFHVYAPLDACTYYGLDNGAEPIQV